MSVFPWVMSAMLTLAPGRDHSELAGAIAHVVDDASPLFRDDADKRRTAAIVVAVAYRESSFRNDAVGDEGHSVCAMQIFGGSRTLLEDADACIRIGLVRLRESMRIDPRNPVAFYAGGPRGYQTEAARRISRDRMAIAAHLVRTVQVQP